MTEIVAFEAIEGLIITLRGERVILDSDLARLYGVPAYRLNEQVKRNWERFPSDFMFTLTVGEMDALRSQNAISKPQGRGGRRTLPYAFTEHGVIMAANVLNSPRAVEMSVYVVRAFVRLRKAIAEHRDLAKRIETVEQTFGEHDHAIREILQAVKALMAPPGKPARRVGSRPGGRGAGE